MRTFIDVAKKDINDNWTWEMTPLVWTEKEINSVGKWIHSWRTYLEVVDCQEAFEIPKVSYD